MGRNCERKVDEFDASTEENKSKSIRGPKEGDKTAIAALRSKDGKERVKDLEEEIEEEAKSRRRIEEEDEEDKYRDRGRDSDRRERRDRGKDRERGRYGDIEERGRHGDREERGRHRDREERGRHDDRDGYGNDKGRRRTVTGTEIEMNRIGGMGMRKRWMMTGGRRRRRGFHEFRGKEGLVHVSQMATRRITNAKDVVKRDQEVYVKVISVSGNNLSLSMRDVDQNSGKDLLPLKRSEVDDGLRNKPSGKERRVRGE
ncbi:UNVERIFIED_CONTAM: putative pre-splicing factor ATP-dependent RNA helicase DEAH5 [Sesamum angustifolium]|uniref:Pre-splicing factor ATP-dependent RNA helicase DEAH5 n=1 Tax=Sesamum angustifolium TaxID=2727405 RepID=A0AAW2IPA3_9LAMI